MTTGGFIDALDEKLVQIDRLMEGILLSVHEHNWEAVLESEAQCISLIKDILDNNIPDERLDVVREYIMKIMEHERELLECAGRARATMYETLKKTSNEHAAISAYSDSIKLRG